MKNLACLLGFHHLEKYKYDRQTYEEQRYYFKCAKCQVTFEV